MNANEPDGPDAVRAALYLAIDLVRHLSSIALATG
jgi:hypothetical protein